MLHIASRGYKIAKNIVISTLDFNLKIKYHNVILGATIMENLIGFESLSIRQNNILFYIIGLSSYDRIQSGLEKNNCISVVCCDGHC